MQPKPAGKNTKPAGSRRLAPYIKDGTIKAFTLFIALFFLHENKNNNKMQNFVILSPLEQFEVLNLISINAPILGHLNIALTNLSLYTLLVLSILIGFHILGNNDVKLIPSK